MRNHAEANLAALIESTDDLIWSVDLDYRLLAFNSAIKQQINSSFGNQLAVGMHLEEAFPPEWAVLWPPFYERVLREGPFLIEYSLVDGSIVELSLNPIVVDGKTTGISVFGKDITRHKETEIALRESLESLSESQKVGGLGSYVLDVRADTWTCSDVIDEIFGIDKDYPRTVTGWTELVHPDERDAMAAYFVNEVVGKRKPFDKEYRIIRRANGAERWVHGMGRLEFDAQGQPTKMRGVIKDITERKQSELKLRDSEDRFRQTFEQAAVGIVHTSFDGPILRCNTRFAEIIGYPIEEVPGLTFQQITAPEDLPDSIVFLDSIPPVATGRATWEKRYIRKDGSLTWVKITVSTQRDAMGRALHYIGVVEDINARKIAEERLSALQDALRASEERYRTAFQTSLDGICISHLGDGRYIDVNKTFLDIMGYKREEVIGRTSVDLNFWVDPGAREDLVEMLRKNASFRDVHIRYRKKDGEFIWVLVSSSVIEIEGVFCTLSILRDISDAKAAEDRLSAAQQALRTSEARYRTAFQMSIDAVNINRISDGLYIEVNQAFLDITGYVREDVIGRSSFEVNIWADVRDRQNLLEILRNNSSCRDLEARFRKKDGTLIWGLMSASVIELDGVPCILSVTRDVSDAKAAEDEIRSLAFYDPLTRLPNRRLLLDRLRHVLATGSYQNRMHALLFIDLDQFKTLNDTLGHQTGDLLLQEVARRLPSCVREADTVARLGGDEFVVMLEDLSETAEDAAEQAKTAAEKILAAVAQPYLIATRECRSTASIGITVFGDRKESADEILQQADIAMDQSKAAGCNTLRFFSPALQTAVNARAAMEEDLRQAIKTNQFVLYYQPQLESTQLIGAEALIRWNHPRHGFLLPGEFIPLAEETGLILPLGDWVLEAACKQIVSWTEQEKPVNISVAVNISARQLRQPDFVKKVLAALDRTGADPQCLELELTESMLADNIEDVIAKMTELKSHGLRFSLDDFGTGYSSLTYLKRLPLDKLKIDGSFVRDILVDATSGAIAQTIISLSRAMGLPVIAEGVETEEQRDFLTRLGCNSFQGFLFSRPLPLDEFERRWVEPGHSFSAIPVEGLLHPGALGAPSGPSLARSRRD